MSTPLSVYMHFQVDFLELMVKKRDIIESEPQLFEMVGKPTEPVTCSNEVCDYIGMGRLALLGITAFLVICCLVNSKSTHSDTN